MRNGHGHDDDDDGSVLLTCCGGVLVLFLSLFVSVSYKLLNLWLLLLGKGELLEDGKRRGRRVGVFVFFVLETGPWWITPSGCSAEKEAKSSGDVCAKNDEHKHEFGGKRQDSETHTTTHQPNNRSGKPWDFGGNLLVTTGSKGIRGRVV